MSLVRKNGRYKEGGDHKVESAKELYPKALLIKPCKICGKSPMLMSDIYGMADSVVYYITCQKEANHSRKIRLYTNPKDAIEGWNLRGGE